MADVVLVATPGAANANSYATVAEADAYHDAHLYGATWTAASANQKAQALVMATRLLDHSIEWDGYPTTDTQALLWPRNSMIGLNGYAVPSDAVPDDLKKATAEFARQLLASDRTSDVESISELTAGPVSLKFAGAASQVVPDAVYYLVRHFGRVRVRKGGVVDLMRA